MKPTLLVNATIEATFLVEAEVDISDDIEIKDLEIICGQRVADTLKKQLGASTDLRKTTVTGMKLRAKVMAT